MLDRFLEIKGLKVCLESIVAVGRHSWVKNNLVKKIKWVDREKDDIIGFFFNRMEDDPILICIADWASVS